MSKRNWFIQQLCHSRSFIIGLANNSQMNAISPYTTILKIVMALDSVSPNLKNTKLYSINLMSDSSNTEFSPEAHILYFSLRSVVVSVLKKSIQYVQLCVLYVFIMLTCLSKTYFETTMLHADAFIVQKDARCY